VFSAMSTRSCMTLPMPMQPDLPTLVVIRGIAGRDLLPPGLDLDERRFHLDRQDAVVEVDVAPQQRQRLADPHAGTEHQVDAHQQNSGGPAPIRSRSRAGSATGSPRASVDAAARRRPRGRTSRAPPGSP
jgi:hypothetical protein